MRYSKEEIDAIMKQFVMFVKNILQKDIRAYQIAVARPIIDSVLNQKGDTFTLLQCRQSGKTEVLIMLSVFLAIYFPGIRIGIYAPTFKQAMELIMRRIKAYLRSDVFSGSFEINRGNMVVFKRDSDITSIFNNVEGSLIGAHSADVSAKIEGATWDLVFIDEAQDIDRAVIDISIEPMLTATAGTMVFTGTPFSSDCAFYDTIQAIKSQKLPGKNFVIDYKTAIKYFPLYEKTVQRAIAKNGIDSLSFQTQYAVQWVGGMGMFFNFDEFIARGDETRGWMFEPIPGFQYVAGLDIGGASKDNDYEPDETVLTICKVEIDESLSIANIFRWKGSSWPHMEAEVMAALKRWRPVAIAIDATGIGQNTGYRIMDSNLVPYTFLVNMSPITKSAIGYNAESMWRLGKMRYPAQIKNANYYDLLEQARWLVRSIKEDSLRKMSWYVSESNGNDDIISSWFLCLWGYRLLKNDGVGVGTSSVPQHTSYSKQQMLRDFFS